MARTPEQLVSSEVHYCVSYLVSTLAGGYGSIENTERLHSRGREAQAALSELAEQAMELCSPIDDWEEAAFQAGAKLSLLDEHSDNAGKWIVLDQPEDSDMWITFYDDERNASIAYCDYHGVEPYQREVFEHWIISDWLADKLEAQGEKVGRDVGGMTIWARTTTGQGIASDGVIERIAADLNKEG